MIAKTEYFIIRILPKYYANKAGGIIEVVPKTQLCVSGTMIPETIRFKYQHISCGNLGDPSGDSFRSTKKPAMPISLACYP
jgi:hypothetical protein